MFLEIYCFIPGNCRRILVPQGYTVQWIHPGSFNGKLTVFWSFAFFFFFDLVEWSVTPALSRVCAKSIGAIICSIECHNLSIYLLPCSISGEFLALSLLPCIDASFTTCSSDLKSIWVYFFFFWPHPLQEKFSDLGIEPSPQQWSKPQQWQCWILNPMSWQGPAESTFNQHLRLSTHWVLDWKLAIYVSTKPHLNGNGSGVRLKKWETSWDLWLTGYP